MKLGIYIHIPFCKQKCLYCDFISYPQRNELHKKYIHSLKKEIENWISNNQNPEIETIYIGGGTPSYIDSENIVNILNLLTKKEPTPNCILTKKEPTPNCFAKKEPTPFWPPNCSTTIEINPGTITRKKLEDYRGAGVNRISIGLQTTKDELLKEIGRIHTYQEFLEAYKLARDTGFSNINVDLMIGLPNQTIQDIKSSLEKIINLKPSGPEHISVYSLIVEENTPMQKLIDEGKLELPDEELERNMYWYVKNFLELNGYNHYEISNFAKPGYESKHNLDCWEQKEYRGFGVSAHSYINNKRFYNTSNLEKYIQNIEDGNFNENIILEEEQNKFDKMKEYMLIGLRKIAGVSISEFENKFNENPIMLFRNELSKLSKEKLIVIDGDIIKLSNKGIDLANLVWMEFV